MSSFLDLSLLLDTLRGPTGYRLLLALLHFIWQGFAIAVVIGVTLRLMRRRRAQFRYLIGLIGLAAMAVTPVVSAFWIEPPAARAPDVFVAPPEPPRELLADPEAISLEVDRIEALLLLLESSLEQAPAGLETAGVVPVEVRKSVSERLQFWQPYLLFVWLLGMSLFALRLAIGARAAWWYRWGAEPLPAGAYELLLQVSKRLGVLPPRVLVSERVVEAVALGLFRPVILLPAAWMLRIPTEQLEAVLAHEIAHLRRHDLWINFAQRVLEALLFYHPAVWWLSRRVRLEREYCCDEIAAQSLNDRAAYARALEFVAAERLLASRLGKLDTALAATMGDNEMALLNRVRKVLGGEPLPSRRRWRWATGAVLVAPLALWSIVLAGELLWATSEKPPVEAPRVVDQATTVIAEPIDPFGADTAASKSSESSPFGARYANEEPVPPSAAVDDEGFGSLPHDVFDREKSSDEPFGMPETAEDAFGPPALADPKDAEIERLKRENAELRVKVSAPEANEQPRAGDGVVDAEVLRQLHDAYASQLTGLEKLLRSRSSATAQDEQIRKLLAARELIGKKVDEIIARANEETKSAAEATSPEDGFNQVVGPPKAEPATENPYNTADNVVPKDREFKRLSDQYNAQLRARNFQGAEETAQILAKRYRGNDAAEKMLIKASLLKAERIAQQDSLRDALDRFENELEQEVLRKGDGHPDVQSLKLWITEIQDRLNEPEKNEAPDQPATAPTSTDDGTGAPIFGQSLSEREIKDAEMMELGKSQKALRIELEHLRKKKGADDPAVKSLEERISSIQEILNDYWVEGSKIRPPESPTVPQAPSVLMDSFSPPSGDDFGSANEKPIDPPPAPVEGDSLSVTFREGGKFVDVAYFDRTLNADVRVSTTPDQLPALLERIAPRLGHADDVPPADNGSSPPLGNPPASYPVPRTDYRSPSDPLVPAPDSPFEAEPRRPTDPKQVADNTTEDWVPRRNSSS